MKNTEKKSSLARKIKEKLEKMSDEQFDKFLDGIRRETSNSEPIDAGEYLKYLENNLYKTNKKKENHERVNKHGSGHPESPLE